MLVGLGVPLVGLGFAAVLPAGLGLLLPMAGLGFGTGTVQSSSLVLAFRQAGSPNRGSMAWNMTFDIGLGIAGLVGGIGFTYLGAQNTYPARAVVLLLTSMRLADSLRQQRRAQ